jgi:hypothetical protein
MALWNCYIDESGTARALQTPNEPNVPPAYVIAAVALNDAVLRAVTSEFIDLKRHYYPGLDPGTGKRLDWMLPEIKGADVRRALSRRGNRNQRRHASRFLNDLLGILERHDARVLGRIWIKSIGVVPDGTAIYTSSVQAIARTFQALLSSEGAEGLMIADSVLPAANARVSHSIFTMKYRGRGDPFPRIREAPLFAHSENHAGIQIADLLCSAMLFPMATTRYCVGHVRNVHVDRAYEANVCAPFAARVKALQFRYQDGARRRGGLVVDDRLQHRSGAVLFAPSTAP